VLTGVSPISAPPTIHKLNYFKIFSYFPPISSSMLRQTSMSQGFPFSGVRGFICRYFKGLWKTKAQEWVGWRKFLEQAKTHRGL
jgi:hypothetical protein